MISRGEDGRLNINRLDVGVAMDDFFIMAQPKNRKEAEWLYERLQEHLEESYEDTIRDFNDDFDDDDEDE
jgi:hypothetical protein